MVSKDEYDDSNVQYIVLQYSVNSFCTYGKGKETKSCPESKQV